MRSSKNKLGINTFSSVCNRVFQLAIVVLATELIVACSRGDHEPAYRSTVIVTEPGSLAEIVPPNQREKVTTLTIEGYLNGDDIAYIRQMPELRELNLEKAILPNNHLPPNAFSSHKRLESAILPSSLDSIGDSAFRWCERLQSLYLPSTLISISPYAFAGCENLHDIDLPASLRHLGKYAFSGCKSLHLINIPSKLTTIDEYTFYQCTSLAEINIPYNIRQIGYKAFSGCSRLRSIRIPSTVMYVGIAAFEDCIELTDISWPTSLTRIEYQTFAGCLSLTSITLHSKLTAIGNYAFDGCKNLVEIHSQNNTPPQIGEGTFRSVNRKACRVVVPSERARKSYNTALYWNEFTIYVE